MLINGSGDLVRIDDPDNTTAIAATYTNHLLTDWVGRRADTTTVTYDSFLQLASVAGPRVSTTDAGLVRPTSTIRSLEAATLPAPGTGTTPVSPRVLPESATVRLVSPRSDTTTMRLHRTGAPLRLETRDPTGKKLVSLYAYDDSNRVTQEVSPSGASTTYTWQGPKLINVEDGAVGSATGIVYIPAYDQVEQVRINGVLVQKFFYNGAKKAPDSVQAYTGGVTATTKFTYDSQGRLLTTTDPESHVSSVAYQASGFQNTQSSTANSHTTSYSYDSYGRVQTVTDPASRSVTTAYDVVNRPTSVTGPNSTTIQYKYDDAQRRDTIIDPILQRYTFTSNAAGWVTTSVDPRGQSESFSYDRHGNVTSYTNRRSQTITTTYDGFDRPLIVAANGDTTRFAYDSARTWSAVSNAESIDTVYVDAAGRVSREVSVKNGVRYEVTSSYLDEGPRLRLQASRITATAWNRGFDFAYDSLLRLKHVPDHAGKLTRRVYNRDGQVTSDTLPTSATPANRLTVTNAYTTAHRLQSTSHNQGLGTLLNRTYNYDALERMYAWTRGAYPDSYQRATSFNALGRIASYSDTHYWTDEAWVCDDPMEIWCPEAGHWEYTPHSQQLRSDTYTYDAVGNRTDKSAVIQTGNRVTSFDGWTIWYDSSGNVTQKQKSGTTQTYTWNAVGQLTQVVVNGVTTTYGYDGWGRRVRKTVNGTTTRYLYDGDNLVVEMDGSGQSLREYSYYPGIDQPHAVRRNSDGAVFYYITERPGHVIALVNASNTAVNTYEYQPFGAGISTTEAVPQPFRFAGREYDAETGLYFMRARYYDPLLDRFISEDPIGLEGGVNPYAYAENDPNNGRDPTGLRSCANCGWPISWETVIQILTGGGRSGTGGGEGGGSGSSNPKADVRKNPKRVMACNRSANTVMAALQHNFNGFASFSSSFAPALAFNAPSQLRVGTSIPISMLAAINGTVISYHTSVTVKSMSPTSLTFATVPGHALFPATISFWALGAGQSQIQFGVDIRGNFANVAWEAGYRAGGSLFENAVWSNLMDNVATFCGSKQ